ncbi:TVP38/TMEM64 family protein [Pontibacter silvestris]|uniref:TVP38/TMEM64 family membrane protein n=1 Tax=Pontibacter silvestris TaxID=2305183 RepID=A0ABW4X338_9BACT|nr:VTT domain-containing protein [Pontibacter silvestris]MCC9137965.1 VTT domain-containing protein [Pontibacter silvestris]
MSRIIWLKSLLRENASTFISMVLLVVVPVVVSSTLAYFFYQHQVLLQNLAWWQMLLYFAVVSVTMGLALTPTTFVALVSGFYLGWSGFPGVVLSYGAAAIVGYSIAKVIDHGKMMGFLNQFEKSRLLMQELQHQSWSLIFLTRISPVLPFALMNFVLSLLQVSMKKFLIASIVGMLPRTFFFFWIGTKANDIINLLQNPDSGSNGRLLMIVLIIISIAGLYFIFDRALKKALKRASTKN